MSTPSLTVPTVVYERTVLPSTTMGLLKISTLVAAVKVWVLITSKPLFVIVIVGVLDPDLLVTCKDFTIYVS